MYRYRDNNCGRGFVFGVRSVVLRDNFSTTLTDEQIISSKYSYAFARHILLSSTHIEKYNIKNCICKQNKQIEYRNMFNELPSNP